MTIKLICDIILKVYFLRKRGRFVRLSETTYTKMPYRMGVGYQNGGFMSDFTVNIGKKVKAKHRHALKNGETAVIIGCCLRTKDNLPSYIIKFKDGKYDTILAGKLFEESGFVYVD